VSPGAFVAELHRRDRVLALSGWLMIAGLMAASVAALIDTRLVLGINPWIKPMKFFASIAIFLWTMAWFMKETDARHQRRLLLIRWTMVLTMVGEVVLISMQAARGTTSHFNVQTSFDARVFDAMGMMIVANSLAVAWFFTTLRPVTSDRAGYLWGVRAGLVLFVIGSFQGFLMVANMGHGIPGPDGGPGLPFVNWSTSGGDLRVAHFIGLHALQVLPIAGFVLDRLAPTPSRRTWVVRIVALVWLAAMAAALMLALAGRPLLTSSGASAPTTASRSKAAASSSSSPSPTTACRSRSPTAGTSTARRWAATLTTAAWPPARGRRHASERIRSIRLRCRHSVTRDRPCGA
jgi:hypothetical protein